MYAGMIAKFPIETRARIHVDRVCTVSIAMQIRYSTDKTLVALVSQLRNCRYDFCGIAACEKSYLV